MELFSAYPVRESYPSVSAGGLASLRRTGHLLLPDVYLQLSEEEGMAGLSRSKAFAESVPEPWILAQPEQLPALLDECL